LPISKTVYPSHTYGTANVSGSQIGMRWYGSNRVLGASRRPLVSSLNLDLDLFADSTRCLDQRIQLY